METFELIALCVTITLIFLISFYLFIQYNSTEQPHRMSVFDWMWNTRNYNERIHQNQPYQLNSNSMHSHRHKNERRLPTITTSQINRGYSNGVRDGVYGYKPTIQISSSASIDNDYNNYNNYNDYNNYNNEYENYNEYENCNEYENYENEYENYNQYENDFETEHLSQLQRRNNLNNLNNLGNENHFVDIDPEDDINPNEQYSYSNHKPSKQRFNGASKVGNFIHFTSGQHQHELDTFIDTSNINNMLPFGNRQRNLNNLNNVNNNFNNNNMNNMNDPFQNNQMNNQNNIQNPFNTNSNENQLGNPFQRLNGCNGGQNNPFTMNDNNMNSNMSFTMNGMDMD